MTALIPHESFTDTTATSSLGHHTIFTPQAQADFLESLASQGNVRLASRAARISAQTAYRARRQSPGFARAWDAARLSARTHAEDALAERALNGWEEPVFYHGEEIARRRRFSDRLLLAHLARLDALAQNMETRDDAAAFVPELDDQIDALRRGEDLDAAVQITKDARAVGAPQDERDFFSQDPVPTVPSCRVPCGDCGGNCDTPEAELGPEDCQWLGNRLGRMEAARPAGAVKPEYMAYDEDDVRAIEMLQLEAFEAEGHEWWLVTELEQLIASCVHDGAGGRTGGCTGGCVGGCSGEEIEEIARSEEGAQTREG